MDLGVGGISFVELLILYELWAGERLSLEKAHPRYLRPGRPISVSAVPFGLGIDIWRSCKLLSAMLRALCAFSGCGPRRRKWEVRRGLAARDSLHSSTTFGLLLRFLSDALARSVGWRRSCSSSARAN